MRDSPCDNLTHSHEPATVQQRRLTVATRKSIEDTVMSLDELVCEHIRRVLAEHNGNISAAARALGMHRRTLQRKLQRQGRAAETGTIPTP
jgi:ActR/RegA family two-component response regulator